MKITLIRPTDHYSTAHPLANMRPLGLFMLATVLDNAGYEVDILDLQVERNQGIPLEQLIQKSESRIFGITALTASRFEAVEIARRIKKVYPSCCVVVGGAHFTHTARETLEQIEDIDVVVKGLGLTAVVGIAQAVEKKETFNDIYSIVYRDSGNIVENMTSEEQDIRLINDLSVYTKFHVEDYWENLRAYPEPIRSMSVISSVGCPGKCVFCAQMVKHYTTRRVSKVVDELQFIKDRFEVEAFNFVDMTFTANPQHVKELCSEILRRGLNIKWWCESRVDIQLPLLKAMKEAGCVSIAAGVESGSDRVLSRISKGITREKIINFCRSCNDLGIYLRLFFMYSHLGETKSDVYESLSFIDKIKCYPMVKVVTFQPTMIFPGTQLELISRKSKLIKEGFSWYEPCEFELNIKLNQIPNIPIYMDLLTTEDLIEISNEAKAVFEPSPLPVTRDNLFKMFFRCMRNLLP